MPPYAFDAKFRCLAHPHALLCYAFIATHRQNAPIIMMIPLYIRHFCRAMLCVNAADAVVRRPSVRLSVTFVYSVETNKRILNIFHRRVVTPF